MKEILKALGKEVLQKTKEKINGMKPKLQLPKTFVEMDVKLGEKIQFSFQIKKPESIKKEKESDGAK